MSLATRAGRTLKGLGALAALAALVAVPPWALTRYVGWPLPTELPTWEQATDALGSDGIPDDILIRSLAVVVWFAWFGLVISVASEAAAAVQGRTARHLPVAGILQPVVGRLVASIAVAVIATLPRTDEPDAPGHLSLASYLHPPPATEQVIDPPQPAPAAHPPGPTAAATTASPDEEVVHIVVRGDTLWALAETHLGDPFRWPEIWKLNAGSTQPDGRTFNDPHWIYPGWHLQLPLTPAPVEIPVPTTSQDAPPEPPPAPPAPEGCPSPSTSTPTSIPPEAATSAPPSEAGPAEPAEAAGTEAGWFELSSGARIGSGFAAGVLTAMALNRLRARRHHQPRTPRPGSPTTSPPTPPPLRDLLNATRKAGVHATPLHPEVTSEAPARIEAATRGGQVITLDLTEWPGVQLSGPGSERTARAWAAHLATRAPGTTEIITTPALARLLFGAQALPNVQTKPDAQGILSRLEAATIARTRTCEDDDLPGIASVRRQHPEAPLPALVVILEGHDQERSTARWRNVLRTGGRLDIAAIILTNQPDPSPPGLHLRIEDDGTVHTTTTGGGNPGIDGAIAFQLDLPTTTALLEPIATAHQIDIEPPGPEPPDRDQEHTATATPEPPAPIGARISFHVLGPLRVEVDGMPITKGLRTASLELLAWYALHPKGATQEAAIDALWPDLDLVRGRQRFWSAIGALRKTLRTATELDDLDLITRTGDRYQPEAGTLDVDLWHFEHALQQAPDTAVHRQVAILEGAASTYEGDFAEGLDSLWVDPVREDLHRRALDTLSRLAQLHEQDGQTQRAIAALERAIELDPYFEHAYRHLIVLHATDGHPEAAQHVWRRLQRHLADLDVDPEPATVAIAHRALSGTSSAVAPIR